MTLARLIDLHSTLEERFWPKVERSRDCWLWTAAKTGAGYGVIGTTRSKYAYAHRVAWEIANGQPVPDGLEVMHSCDIKACVNPEHLSVGTHAQNMAQVAERGRSTRKFDYDRIKKLRDEGWTLWAIAHEVGAANHSVIAKALNSMEAQ